MHAGGGSAHETLTGDGTSSASRLSRVDPISSANFTHHSPCTGCRCVMLRFIILDTKVEGRGLGVGGFGFESGLACAKGRWIEANGLLGARDRQSRLRVHRCWPRRYRGHAKPARRPFRPGLARSRRPRSNRTGGRSRRSGRAPPPAAIPLSRHSPHRQIRHSHTRRRTRLHNTNLPIPSSRAASGGQMATSDSSTTTRRPVPFRVARSISAMQRTGSSFKIRVPST
jgi:hypothetical protein